MKGKENSIDGVLRLLKDKLGRDVSPECMAPPNRAAFAEGLLHGIAFGAWACGKVMSGKPRQ